MTVIYHITAESAWQVAEAEGVYRADSMDREGFIHCSTRTQVAQTFARYYRDVPGLLLLAIDPRRLKTELRYEISTGGELFPHIYGPLNLDAVLSTRPYTGGELEPQMDEDAC